MRSAALAFVVCAFGCSKNPTEAPQVGSAAVPAPKDTSERWSASIVLGANIRDFVVRFDHGATTTAALEGLTKEPLPLADVTLEADRIAFTLEKPKAPKETWEHYTLTRARDKASGTGIVAGTTLRIAMVKLGPTEAPHSAFPRPQTPKPPFPYSSREVIVEAPDGGKLAGTLTLPSITPAPAVLLWSGSGQQDRDETIFGHKPFLIIADRLTRAGFAVLRLDDRGTGTTVGALGTLRTEIADAGAAFDFLTKQKEVDVKRAGMIVHSTGGMVGPNVALAHPVSFIVSLAGVAIPGRDLVLLQQQVAAKAAGATVPPEQVAQQKAIGEATLGGPEKVKKVLSDLASTQLAKSLGHDPTPEEIEQAIAQPLAEVTQPWTLSYFTIDPREAWRKLSIPVLLVVGDLDTQVPAGPTIAALLGAHAKTSAVTAKKLPGLNHLFQHAKTGLTDEYLEIEESFDPAALGIITTWLVDVAKPNAKPSAKP
jgi:pimeloyl-ACP methyl ester carboxylesterase